MVVFTCNHCGESLQKPKVEKHYFTMCRNAPKSLTCVDCFKDFKDEEFAVHTKCITESERYAAKGAFPEGIVKKGDKKQESWIDNIKEIIDSTANMKPSHKQIFNIVSSSTNVPRKKKKFINFIASASGHKASKKDIEEVWDIIENQIKNKPEEKVDAEDEEKKQNVATEVSLENKKTKKKKNKKGVESQDTAKAENQTEDVDDGDDKVNPENKKSKKKKNEKGAETEEISTVETENKNGVTDDTKTNSSDDKLENKKSKKKKNKKGAESEKIGTAQTENKISMTDDTKTNSNDDKLEASSDNKKSKKKKNKHGNDEEIDTVSAINENGKIDVSSDNKLEVSTENKKSKKKKNKKELEINAADEKTSEKVVDKKLTEEENKNGLIEASKLNEEKSKKSKKKKNKQSSQINQTNGDSNVLQKQNDDQLENKGGKKQKKRKTNTAVVDTESSANKKLKTENVESNNVPANDKQSKKRKTDATENGASEEKKVKEDKESFGFCYKEQILSVINVKKSMPIDKLEKKVLSVYQELTGKEPAAMVHRKFQKHLKKIANVEIDDNNVRLIEN